MRALTGSCLRPLNVRQPDFALKREPQDLREERNVAEGGRAFISLESLGGVFCFLPMFDEKKRVVGFEIAASGNDGVDAVRKALNFACDAIHDQCI